MEDGALLVLNLEYLDVAVLLFVACVHDVFITLIMIIHKNGMIYLGEFG